MHVRILRKNKQRNSRHYLHSRRSNHADSVKEFNKHALKKARKLILKKWIITRRGLPLYQLHCSRIRITTLFSPHTHFNHNSSENQILKFFLFIAFSLFTFVYSGILLMSSKSRLRKLSIAAYMLFCNWDELSSRLWVVWAL